MSIAEEISALNSAIGNRKPAITIPLVPQTLTNTMGEQDG
jgi:hypothetical protein